MLAGVSLLAGVLAAHRGAANARLASRFEYIPYRQHRQLTANKESLIP
jgi:hypothetical protein